MNHVGLANRFLLGNPDFTKEHDGRYIAGHYAFDLLFGQLASIAYMSETKRKGCFSGRFRSKGVHRFHTGIRWEFVLWRAGRGRENWYSCCALTRGENAIMMWS